MNTNKPDDTPILLAEMQTQGIMRLTMNNPARRNALSEAMLTELHRHITEAAGDPAVRVIVLAARGSVFCSGHDLRELSDARESSDSGREFFTRIMSMCSDLMQAIVNNPKPVIAEVSGIATAAGCQLVASCDLAYAADSTLFSTPGVNIGLFCSTPMVALSRNVANKHAMEMLLSGEMISAEKAVETGLINRAVTPEKLTRTTMIMASTIASKSSKTVATGKLAFYRQQTMPLSDAYQYCANIMVENMLEQDAEEGINAFLAKRTPQWSDC